jgi:DNA repair protein RecN (Recombination protein N)
VLTQIHIRDLAIVERIDLAIEPGMTVFTGETGAGKSIVIGALTLALGDRADAQMVRPGSEQAEVVVSFDLQRLEGVRQWLRARDLDGADECLIRRTISREGRSRAYVNDAPVSLQALRELGQLLVDVHGQHEHQSLLRKDIQRQLLDDYGGHGLTAQQVADLYRAWTDGQSGLTELSRLREDRHARAALLGHELEELRELDLKEGEVGALWEEHRRLANVHRLMQGARAALDTLYDDPDHAMAGLLNRTAGDLDQLAALDGALREACQILSQGCVYVQEASTELRRYLGHLEADPERLYRVEHRLALVQDLARKHRVAPEELPAAAKRLEEEWTALQATDARLQALAAEVQRLSQGYQALASDLRRARQDAAAALNQQVSRDIQRLGMPGGRFAAELEPLERPMLHGTEAVDFRVSANPGHPMMALGRVASGGELARISLAIHVATARNARIPTLVFDEVDVGIGGKVAETVGQHLLAVAQSRQALCITHLPQVAALAHRHVRVTKDSSAPLATAQARYLSPEERVEEIARMSGGAEITDRTLAHARDLLERAQRHPRQDAEAS